MHFIVKIQFHAPYYLDPYEITSLYQEFDLKVQNDTMFHHHREHVFAAQPCSVLIKVRIERIVIDTTLHLNICTDAEPQTPSFCENIGCHLWCYNAHFIYLFIFFVTG